MMIPVVVYGAGGMGREVADAVLAAVQAGAQWDLLGFIDDGPALDAPRTVHGLPILGPAEWLADHPDVQAALGVGHPRTRRKIVRMVTEIGNRWATVVHPTAIVAPSAEVGEGAVVFARCVLSSDVRLGRFCYLNYGTVVSHDARVGDHACVMAQVALSGGVNVGEGAFVGVGVSTRQGVTIGEWSIVGAGASVVQDIPSLCTAVGVPAKPIRFHGCPEEMPPF